MKNTNRFIALALCFTLTLGVFAYRPPRAEAIAGVDDAVVIGALLSAFAGGCGLIFSNNGMTSGELAQGLTDKWNEFKAAVLETDTTFAGWLGYEDMDALLQAIVLSGGNALTVPRAVAHKFSDFTTWFTQDLGVTAGGDSKPVLSPLRAFTLENGQILRVSSNYTESTIFDFDEEIKFSNRNSFLVSIGSRYNAIEVTVTHLTGDCPVSSYGSSFGSFGVEGASVCLCYYPSEDSYAVTLYKMKNGTPVVNTGYKWPAADFEVSFGGHSLSSRLSVFAPSYYKNPTIDLPVEGEGAANPTLSGVGDGTATTVEDLLQQILAQLQANTLAPTLEVAGTEAGGNTGTDEDAKPYLPYIPQIFEKIKELPGTLANIWESIKGIPAAIAEKIGAFFTTLWGWLQNIIDAITALPAAIAEKVGELFKPDEALITEITDTFKGKFGFLPVLKQFGDDLFGMTAETEPPVIWIHLENAESKYGYDYGGKEVALDLAWYQKYKPSVDGIVSGFMWLGYLWMLFTKAPDILNGMGLRNEAVPPMPNLEYINPLRLNGRASKRRRE